VAPEQLVEMHLERPEEPPRVHANDDDEVRQTDEELQRLEDADDDVVPAPIEVVDVDDDPVDRLARAVCHTAAARLATLVDQLAQALEREADLRHDTELLAAEPVHRLRLGVAREG